MTAGSMSWSSGVRMEKRLAEMKEGEKGRIVRIDEHRGPLGRGKGRGFMGGRCHQRRNLQTLGIREGKTVEIHSRQPIGGPIVIKIDNMTLTLGRMMAGRIIVEVQE